MARAHRSLSCGLVYGHRSLTSIMEAKRLSSYAEGLGGLQNFYIPSLMLMISSPKLLAQISLHLCLKGNLSKKFWAGNH